MDLTSEQARQELAATGRPVILGMSRGKDALATWCALADHDITVIPVHLDLIPGLQFVDDDIARLEDHFGQRIHRLPHPGFYRWLTNLVYQPPERCAVIEAANLNAYDYAELWEAFRADQNLDPDTWIAIGTRSADSIHRRMSWQKHGPWRPKTREVWAIGDWKIADVRACLAAHNVQLGVDYAWFKRSFDGIDYRFLEPLRRHAPDDYQRVLDWFPLADLAIWRHDMEAAHATQA